MDKTSNFFLFFRDDCYFLLTDLIRNTTSANLYEHYLIDKFYYGTIDIVTYHNTRLCNICLKDILLEKRIALPSYNFKHGNTILYFIFFSLFTFLKIRISVLYSSHVLCQLIRSQLLLEFYQY